MNLYKIMFFNSMILGSLIAVSAYSWFAMWMGLEINLLSIIPLISSKNPFSNESSIKYFIVQALASMILLMTVVSSLLTNEFMAPNVNSWINIVMNSALLMKMGAAPFHFWFPEVMEGLSWMTCLIILTWQKIAPMMILMSNKMNSALMTFTVIMCVLISSISVMNQISLRKILAFSSINHTAWMISAMEISQSIWLLYFTIYSLMNINITMILNSTKTFFLQQMFATMNKNPLTKISFTMNFLSLGGVPPMIGFFPKWVIINWMVSNSLHMMALILIIFTLVMLFTYVKISISSLVININEPKIENNPKSISLANSFTLTSLILCTISFNFI